jgi:hypothetical protein
LHGGFDKECPHGHVLKAIQKRYDDWLYAAAITSIVQKGKDFMDGDYGLLVKTMHGLDLALVGFVHVFKELLVGFIG